MPKNIPCQAPGLAFSGFSSFIDSILIDAHELSDENIHLLFEFFDQDDDGKLSEIETDRLNKVLVDRINALRCALIIVDFQNDFVTGSLAIKKGSARQDPREALVPLNQLLAKNTFDLVVYTLDWHPSNHISFYEHCRNGDRKLRKEDKARKLRPLETVTFDEPCCTQTLYPAHCVQGSWGADLCPELVRVENARYVKKGTNVFVDSYSAFYDNNSENKTELEEILKNEKIDALFICGLAYDICVAYTIRDATRLNFYSALIADCSKGLNKDTIDSVNAEFRSSNVPVLDSRSVEAFLDDKKVSWRWLWKMLNLEHKLPKSNENSTLNVKFENNNKLYGGGMNGSALIQHELAAKLSGQMAEGGMKNLKQIEA